MKAAEAQLAAALGAVELDMVIDLGLAKAGMWSEVEADIVARALTQAGELQVPVLGVVDTLVVDPTNLSGLVNESISGTFQLPGGGALPELDLQVLVEGGGEDLKDCVILTRDN